MRERDDDEPTTSTCCQRSAVTALGSVATCLLTMVVVVGCASTRIIEHRPYDGGKVARPDRIMVHAFAATHADIPAGSALADEAARHGRPQTVGEIEVGRIPAHRFGYCTP